MPVTMRRPGAPSPAAASARSRGTRRSIVTETVGRTSAKSVASSRSTESGFTGTATAPARTVPRKAMTKAGQVGRCRLIRSPGWTPIPRRTCAKRLAAASSWAKLVFAPKKTSAVRSGVRSAVRRRRPSTAISGTRDVAGTPSW